MYGRLKGKQIKWINICKKTSIWPQTNYEDANREIRMVHLAESFPFLSFFLSLYYVIFERYCVQQETYFRKVLLIPSTNVLITSSVVIYYSINDGSLTGLWSSFTALFNDIYDFLMTLCHVLCWMMIDWFIVKCFQVHRQDNFKIPGRHYSLIERTPPRHYSLKRIQCLVFSTFIKSMLVIVSDEFNATTAFSHSTNSFFQRTLSWKTNISMTSLQSSMTVMPVSGALIL